MGSAGVLFGGRAAVTSALTWLVLLISIMVPASHEDERLRWCGKRLNPRDFARGMRAATDLMLACKEQIVTLNLSPLVLREHRRLCVTLRMCYAFTTYSDGTPTGFQKAFLYCLERLLTTAQIINPVLMEEIRLNVTNLLIAANTCALKHIPREEKYALAILAYFADFISG
ncbi:uncharacterized protein LOC125759261 [Rhipicephalus sanguineus]|uniref:uncharacterized protein LOC125759261 n=1 Tax=Rhipicephalus sanguineus TaxID=34632 RepID=UPI0020C21099|nr:uncharacterized protein LOC125759261 [Rhipicephalus sanguineus]